MTFCPFNNRKFRSQGLTAAFGQVFIGGVALITLRSSYGRNLLPAALF